MENLAKRDEIEVRTKIEKLTIADVKKPSVDSERYIKKLEISARNVHNSENILKNSNDNEYITLFTNESESFEEVQSNASLSDFFNCLANIPSISGLLESATEETSSEENTPNIGDELNARFSEVQAEKLSADSQFNEQTFRKLCLEEHSVDDSQSSETDDFLELSNAEGDEPDKPVNDYEDAFDKLFVGEMENLLISTYFEDFEWDREEAARHVRKNIDYILDKLISRIVYKSEYVDSKAILRININSVKLTNELYKRLQQFEVEQKARTFVNKKTADFYRRKKAFRAITEDSLESVQRVKIKLRTAAMHLDRTLGKEEETRERLALNIENLESEIFDWDCRTRRSVRDFEDLVRKTFYRDTFDRLPTVVDFLLRRMSSFSNEISGFRLKILSCQHLYAVLLEKLTKLEDLGNGLHMQAFERLQIDVQVLGKKIEGINRSNSVFH